MEGKENIFSAGLFQRLSASKKIKWIHTCYIKCLEQGLAHNKHYLGVCNYTKVHATSLGTWREIQWFKSFPGVTSGKESTCQCRRRKRHWFDPWVGKISGGGHGYPLQYSYLENPMDRGAWWATVHGVTKVWTRLKQLSMHVQAQTVQRRGNSAIGAQDFWQMLLTFDPMLVLLGMYPKEMARSLGKSIRKRQVQGRSIRVLYRTEGIMVMVMGKAGLCVH